MIEFDTSEIISELRWLPKAIQKRTIALLAQETYDVAQDGSQAHVKTGQLHRALFMLARGEVGRAVGISPKRAPYGIYVLFGSRPHVIKPKNKKALRWPSGGEFIFAKSVNHPGYRGDNYLYRGGDAAIDKFKAFVDQAWEEQRNA